MNKLDRFLSRSLATSLFLIIGLLSPSFTSLLTLGEQIAIVHAAPDGPMRGLGGASLNGYAIALADRKSVDYTVGGQRNLGVWDKVIYLEGPQKGRVVWQGWVLRVSTTEDKTVGDLIADNNDDWIGPLDQSLLYRHAPTGFGFENFEATVKGNKLLQVITYKKNSVYSYSSRTVPVSANGINWGGATSWKRTTWKP